MTKTRLLGILSSAGLLAITAGVAGAASADTHIGTLATLGLAIPGPGPLALALGGGLLFLARKRVFERKRRLLRALCASKGAAPNESAQA